MDCYNCNSEMRLVKEIESRVYSLDIYQCPICKSSAEVRYKGNQEDIVRVLWESN